MFLRPVKCMYVVIAVHIHTDASFHEFFLSLTTKITYIPIVLKYILTYLLIGSEHKENSLSSEFRTDMKFGKATIFCAVRIYTHNVSFWTKYKA